MCEVVGNVLVFPYRFSSSALVPMGNTEILAQKMRREVKMPFYEMMSLVEPTVFH